MRKVRSCLFALVLAVAVAMNVLSGSSLLVKAEGALSVAYEIHMTRNGWTGAVRDGLTCGPSEDGRFIEAVKVSLENKPFAGGVTYQTCLAERGWGKWVNDGETSGATNLEKPVEAIRMDLTGEMQQNYDIYYRVNQDGQWADWVANNQIAGTEGQGTQIQGIMVALGDKGSGTPNLMAGLVTEESVTGIDPSKPMVALTFDDGPYAPVTDRILDSLEANGGRATFFVVGNRVSTYASSVERMVDLGCEVANHTYTHANLTKLDDASIQSQLARTNSAVYNTAGVTPTLMRPTGGAYNQRVLSAIGMPAVTWSIDTIDWKTRNAAKTVSAVLDHVRDGDIILMHDIHGATGDAAVVIIPELVARGYQLVTVSELAASRGGMEAGEVYNSLRPQRE